MQPNPALRALGLGPQDRAVIFHADDLGLCQAGVAAFEELVDFGIVSSGAVMVPCPWFPAMAAYAREHPGVDLGVHLDLNAEHDSLRWGPLSTRDPATGLLDAEGYFPRTPEAVQAQAAPEAVAAELEAQVARALAAGIDVTHVDTHMGTVAHPKFASAYAQVALQHALPLMLMRLDEPAWQAMGMPAEMAALAAHIVAQLEAQGLPLVDHVAMLPLDRPDDRVERAKAAIDALPPGITHFIIHPAKDTPELRALTSDWPSRAADYRAFTDDGLCAFVRAAGVHIIGYRALRDVLRVRGVA